VAAEKPAPKPKTYMVLKGINYPPNGKRAEPGDHVTDLPDFAIKGLLAAEVIIEVVEE
jgi:hypothetical protein